MGYFDRAYYWFWGEQRYRVSSDTYEKREHPPCFLRCCICRFCSPHLLLAFFVGRVFAKIDGVCTSGSTALVIPGYCAERLSRLPLSSPEGKTSDQSTALSRRPPRAKPPQGGTYDPSEGCLRSINSRPLPLERHTRFWGQTTWNLCDEKLTVLKGLKNHTPVLFYSDSK